MLFGYYLVAELDALIANIHTGARDKFADLRLTFSAE